MFSHFIITRFNVPFENYLNDKNGKEVRNIDWLDERFKLFEKYCFPSIVNQSNKNFKWLVFFDLETPSSFVQRINHLCEESGCMEPVYINSGKEFLIELNKKIFSLKRKEDAYIITTRIDNDDALYFNYVEDVQKKFQKQNDVIFNFKNGYLVFDVLPPYL